MERKLMNRSQSPPLSNKLIQVGINIYGYDVLIWFVGYVGDAKYYSIGKKFRFLIQGKEYVSYANMPIFILQNNNEISFSDKNKFNRILELIIGVMRNKGIPEYKNLGIKIVYIENKPN